MLVVLVRSSQESRYVTMCAGPCAPPPRRRSAKGPDSPVAGSAVPAAGHRESRGRRVAGRVARRATRSCRQFSATCRILSLLLFGVLSLSPLLVDRKSVV